MSTKQKFILAHDMARRGAMEAVARAPAGFVVEVREPSRNLDQNALLWVLLTEFSRQLEWPVNGKMVRLSPEDWKTILSASFRRETQRMTQGVDGGLVMLGARTSQMGKREFAEFIEFIQSVAAERGVELQQQEAAA